jgi:hypothetical protein
MWLFWVLVAVFAVGFIVSYVVGVRQAKPWGQPLLVLCVLGLVVVAMLLVLAVAVVATSVMRNVSEVLRGREIGSALHAVGWPSAGGSPATQAPPLTQVRLRSHAVERHGDEAVIARQRVFNCSMEDLRAKICPAGEKYGMRVHFWCEDDASRLCPGMITTIGGVEKTSFVKPCSYWERCQ